MRRFTTFLGLMFVQFALLAANFRFVAQAHYVGAVGTDIAIATLGWTITKRIVDATSWVDRAGYVAGAACGSMLGIWLT